MVFKYCAPVGPSSLNWHDFCHLHQAMSSSGCMWSRIRAMAMSSGHMSSSLRMRLSKATNLSVRCIVALQTHALFLLVRIHVVWIPPGLLAPHLYVIATGVSLSVWVCKLENQFSKGERVWLSPTALRTPSPHRGSSCGLGRELGELFPAAFRSLLLN
jgi:hypothetical protein